MIKNKYRGSSFDDFLEKENLKAEVAARAAKKTYLFQLEKIMKKNEIKKNAIRKIFKSPETTKRVFSEHVGVNLLTLSRAANVVGCDLEIKLVPRKKKAV